MKGRRFESCTAESLKSKLDGKDDGVFIVYGHGNNTGVQYTDKDGTTQKARSPKELDNVLTENDKSGAWKEAMKKGKDVTLMVYACNVAARNYTHVYEDGTKKNFPVTITFAEKVSDKFPNVHVVGATGHVLYVLRPNGEGIIFGVKNSLLGNGRMAGIGKERKKKNNSKGDEK